MEETMAAEMEEEKMKVEKMKDNLLYFGKHLTMNQKTKAFLISGIAILAVSLTLEALYYMKNNEYMTNIGKCYHKYNEFHKQND